MQNPIVKKYGPYLLNTPIGMFIGVIAGIVLSWILSGEFGTEWTRLYTFVVTALISLAVAGFALFGVFISIGTQFERDEEARRRKLMAANALLPSALSGMCKTFMSGAKASVELAENDALREDPEFEKSTRADLMLSESALQTIRDVIEQHHRDQAEVAHRLSDLLKLHQVYFARWQGEFDDEEMLVSEEQNFERTVNWAGLYAVSETMFNYARERGDMKPIDQSGVVRALKFTVNPHFLRHEDEYLREAKSEERWLQENVR
ncbi:hypothetical protein [Aliiroseovarius marinus]|uniref:hypothetical protein n=1 Tax=Aliiroseovarius marinus TaxID=2500159 RepID=UPI0024943D83|nr:hypothetical protein [Aliiroseovarius marinus]